MPDAPRPDQDPPGEHLGERVEERVRLADRRPLAVEPQRRQVVHLRQHCCHARDRQLRLDADHPAFLDRQHADESLRSRGPSPVPPSLEPEFASPRASRQQLGGGGRHLGPRPLDERHLADRLSGVRVIRHGGPTSMGHWPPEMRSADSLSRQSRSLVPSGQ